MFNSKKNEALFWEGVVLGGMLGAAATFALKTAKGKKLQKQLLKTYKGLGLKAGHVGHYLEGMRKKLSKKSRPKKSKKRASRKNFHTEEKRNVA